MTRDATPTNPAARSAMRAFYSALEDKVKRFQPIGYAPFAAQMMRQGFDDLKTGVYFPPFKILHSIEANYAYARGQNRDTVDRYRLGAVMNVWHDNPNPLFEDAINKNVQHCVLLMHREQMELQHHHSPDETARTQLLFVSGNPMPGVAAEFAERYGLTIENWMHLCWLTYVASNRHPSGCFLKSAIRAYNEIEIGDDEINTPGTSVDSLYAEKQELPYIEVGDWLRFTDRKLRDLGNRIHPLPFVEAEIDTLLRSMGGPSPVREADG